MGNMRERRQGGRRHVFHSSTIFSCVKALTPERLDRVVEEDRPNQASYG